jgi:putative transcriptional regulator
MRKEKMMMLIRKTIIAFLLMVPSSYVLSDEPQKIIIASESLHDGYFDRTVIMIQEHGAHGETIGMILNRPSKQLLSDLVEIPDSSPLAQEPVYLGGPIANGHLSALVKSQQSPQNGLQLSPSLYLTMDLKSLSDDWDKIGVEQVKIFNGYSGWAPKQLKSEFARETWFWGEINEELLFAKNTEGMWKKLFNYFSGLYVYWMNKDTVFS